MGKRQDHAVRVKEDEWKDRARFETKEEAAAGRQRILDLTGYCYFVSSCRYKGCGGWHLKKAKHQDVRINTLLRGVREQGYCSNELGMI